MDTFLAIASRRDERRYAAEALPDDLVQRILDAGRLSGSARNRQPWVFVVPSGRAKLDQLAATVYVPENVTSAGLVVALVIHGKSGATFDAGRAAQSMLLAAWNEGVASCPNGVADQAAACAILGAAEEERVAIVLSFGLPEQRRDPGAHEADEWSRRANRRPLERRGAPTDVRGGIDLGGTKIQAVVIRRGSKVVGSARRDTPAGGGPAEVVSAMAETVRDALERAGGGVAELGGSGSACPVRSTLRRER